MFDLRSFAAILRHVVLRAAFVDTVSGNRIAGDVSII